MFSTWSTAERGRRRISVGSAGEVNANHSPALGRPAGRTQAGGGFVAKSRHHLENGGEQ